MKISLRRVVQRSVFAFVVIAALGAGFTETLSGDSPVSLIQAVVTNELSDRSQETLWQYHVQKTVEGQTLTEEQIETLQGPLFRILAINGTPLSEQQRREDNARMDQLIHDPRQQAKVKQQHDQDEQRLERITRLLPQAFLFEANGAEGTFKRFKFRPNPAFNPPSLETRALSSMAGTMLIDPQRKRLAHLRGTLINRVDFGFGLLGRIEKGGTFEIEREPVAPEHWKTHLVDVNLSGHLLLFKTISKQQHEVRSDFHAVSYGITLEQARQALLNH